MIFNRHAVLALMHKSVLSQSELAVAAQISVSHLSEMLGGKGRPSPATVRAIAKALDVDSQAFYFRPDATELKKAAAA